MKHRRYLIYVLILLAIGGLVVGAILVKRPQSVSVSKSKFIMDTVVEIRATGLDPEAAIDAAF